VNAIDVPVGTRIKLYGQELTVTRKDFPFLGRDNMVLLVESTDERWHCLPAGTAAVCFSSSAAYQIAPYVDPAHDPILDDPLAADFLDQITADVTDSGHAYSLAKRGVIRAVARAAVAWGRRGGRVNSLAPGLIDTPMGRQEFEQQPMMQVMLDKTPLGRLGQADEVAAVVAFLLSDDASFISGIDVLVDGGMLQGMAAAPKS
jgi:NAD(P)-dependent dehydrogenase (short-subunit alcohol dehydrogenase family)